MGVQQGSHSQDLWPAQFCPLCPSPNPRYRPQAEEEEEEPEGVLRQQDLQEACMQLTQGVQEWQDGCVYQGQFGLGMKMGSGEFSWPTGEVTGFQCFLPPCLGLDQQGPSPLLPRGI